MHFKGNILNPSSVFLERPLFPNVCLNPDYQSCFSLRGFFPTVNVVFGRWVLHTSVSRHNGTHPKVGHFSQHFALFEWMPSPPIYPLHEREGLHNPPWL